MARENIAAYTGSGWDYPPFVNVSRLDNGHYSITVRGARNNGEDIAEIELSRDAFKVFLQTLNDHIGDV